jgi:hypothetical protein
LPDRDLELMAIGRSLIDSARRDWPDRLVTEPNGKGDPAQLYTETHYALSAVLLFLSGDPDRGLLDLAEHRLRLWNRASGPMFAFNAMAVCLTAIVLRRAREEHAGLQSIVQDLLARTRDYRHDVYQMNCGNNAYLQQVAVDMVLLPIARERNVTADGVDYLVDQFRRYRTPEGFFHDLPRRGNDREWLCPPSYIMKMLFLAGMCDELHAAPALAQHFQSGMAAALPLLTRDGLFAYFGRTDNSPFAAGLTIFNLRRAAQLSDDARRSYDAAAAAAEKYYARFPRTPSGLLQCNRFGDARASGEYDWSRDDYAYVGQYSLASCAYALLGRLWFPASSERSPVFRAGHAATSVAVSHDLGVVKLDTPDSELILRTGSELTSWDRRYLGPTILRFERQGRLLVGAISRTISTDAIVRPRRASRVARAWVLFRDRFVNGIEQLDGTSVGFLPVLRHGQTDYLPFGSLSQDVSNAHVRTRHEMVRLDGRGVRACVRAGVEQLQQQLPLMRPRYYRRPPVKSAPSLQLHRDVFLTAQGCRIEDRISGNLRGKTLLFSIRHLPGAVVRVRGLDALRSATGWGSDGRQELTVYQRRAAGTEIRYECDIELAERA